MVEFTGDPGHDMAALRARERAAGKVEVLEGLLEDVAYAYSHPHGEPFQQIVLVIRRRLEAARKEAGNVH